MVNVFALKEVQMILMIQTANVLFVIYHARNAMVLDQMIVFHANKTMFQMEMAVAFVI